MERYDHVIVGGGIIGASIAYHLASKNCGSVLLLERNELASAASSQAAGLILQATSKPAKTALAKRTIELIPILEDLLEESVGFHAVGSVRIAASDASTDALDELANDASVHDIPLQGLSSADLQDRVRWLNTSTIRKSVFFPSDGYADPFLLSTAYARAAAHCGAEIRPRTAVGDIITENNRIQGIVTNSGTIACGTVIDAAGVWASALSELAGFPLPMTPVRSHYWVAEPSADFGDDHPVTILPDASAYTRPDRGGLVLGVQEPHSATFDSRDLPADLSEFSATQGEEHWDVLTDAYENLEQFFPALGEARFSAYVSGLSCYTPDGEILLGPAPAISGFYVAAGDCGAGVTLSGGIGAVISDMVQGNETDADVTPFRPDRFGVVDPYSMPFRKQCAAARASKSRKAISIPRTG